MLIENDSEALAIAEGCLFAPAKTAMTVALQIPSPCFSLQALFNDPETGAPLIYDALSPGFHRNADGKIFTGDAYDRVWNAITHDRNARAARQCALAGMMTGNSDWLDRSREILFSYAEAYQNYPPHGVLSATWGRLFHQALNESVWSISMLWTLECLWHGGRISDSEVRLLRECLFQPLADLIWGEWYFVHNIRMWHNAALGSMGLAFGDRSLIRMAIYGDKGYRQQLVDGYRWRDGFSCEGSTGYHAYGLMAMVFLAEAMSRHGYEPYRDPHLLSAMLVPYRLLQPDGSAPALGDLIPSQKLPTRLYASAIRRYEGNEEIAAISRMACRQWKDGGFAPDFEMAEWNDTTAYYGRSEVDWILSLPALKKTTGKLRWQGACLYGDSGLAILRPGHGSYLLLKSAAPTGSHDHFDRLGFIWWEDGICWFDDPGTCYYSHALHEGWFKHTASHNTAMVDGICQEKGEGTVDIPSENSLFAKATPYPKEMPDVRIQRRLTRIDNGWQDEFQMQACRSRQLDLLFHPRGVLKTDLADSREGSFLATKLSPHAIRNVRTIPLIDGRAPRLFFANRDRYLEWSCERFPAGACLIVGQAPSDPRNHAVLSPFVALRAEGQSITFHTTMRSRAEIPPSLNG